MERVGESPMYVEYDDGTDVWDVYQRRGRKTEGKGFVFEQIDGKWSSSRHTFTGVPAAHGEDFATRDDAALSLRDAVPFRDAKHNHPSLTNER